MPRRHRVARSRLKRGPVRRVRRVGGGGSSSFAVSALPLADSLLRALSRDESPSHDAVDRSGCSPEDGHESALLPACIAHPSCLKPPSPRTEQSRDRRRPKKSSPPPPIKTTLDESRRLRALRSAVTQPDRRP
uniref:Uncharacterized protein n=1 Tax=Plectus sambesii TaxID=2011161 RepID=A0A914W465_9BILA